MELEEAEEEEWETTTIGQYLSKPNANSSGSKVNCVFKRGLTLGKKIFVAGFVASSAPFVVPPLIVVSAIGLTVSMPYALFLATHTCTKRLMSRLLPMPISHPHAHHLLDDLCFQPDIDNADKSKEEPVFKDESKTDNTGIVDVNEENMTLRSDYEEGVVKGGEEEPSSGKDDDDEKLGDGELEGYLNGENIGEQPISVGHGNEIEESGVTTVVLEEFDDEEPSLQKDDDEKLEEKIYGRMEGYLSGENDVEQPISGDHDNEIEFGVTTVALEECEDEVKEGDIEEEKLQRETKGLLEKIRDEGRTDMKGEYVEEIHGGTNESDQNIGLVVENMEIPREDIRSLETEGDMRNIEDLRVCEEKLQSRNGDESDDKDADTIIRNEVELGESLSGILELDGSNYSQKPIAETCESELLDGGGIQCETILVESIGDMLIEAQIFNISAAGDTSEITNDKTDMPKAFEEKPESTLLQKGKSDDDISDFVNQEALLHEDNILISSSDADAREIATESGFHSCDENIIDPGVYSYTIDLHEESSNIKSDLHTDLMEVLVSSIKQESRASGNVISPSEEVLFNEGDIWKQIHAIRKIIGCEGSTQSSCGDELKALYVFTGVEPPTFVKENPFDPAEISEKLHFLMSIVGIKPNVP